MGGWLLERFEHGIKRMRREHVDFVDHIDLRAPRDRRVDGRIEQLRHLVNAPVAGGVHFDVIREPPAIDSDTCTAAPTGCWTDTDFAVQCFGEDPRN